MKAQNKQMKPTLRMIRGLWHCGRMNWHQVQRIGTGYTPADAYADWKAGAQ